MCIVTYVPTTTGFILTFNRDENPERLALPPDYHYFFNQLLLYPEDTKARGSWFAINLKRYRLGCIMNAQQPQDSYPTKSKSRGLFLLYQLIYQNSEGQLVDYRLRDYLPFKYLSLEFKTKPFTLVVYHWDGIKLSQKSKDINKRDIWSSLSLYSGEKHLENKEIFDKWTSENKGTDQDGLLELHHNQFNQPLKSKNFYPHQQDLPIQTVSVTSLKVDEVNKKMIHLDLVKKQKIFREFY
ncbi:MAG: NRDE family protein [Flavobacteriaceae bacterium]|nr:NRDE family protein [Flavobacteriaceae bacterium]